MRKIQERLDALLTEMSRAGVQAYIIPSSDPHMGEYIPDCWEARRWFSGFGGSAGTLVVTRRESGLWTDGRYFIQAEQELEGSGIRLFRMGVSGVPSYRDFLFQNLSRGDTAAFDGRMLSSADGEALKKRLAKKGIAIRTLDLISPVWKSRPVQPRTRAFLHGEEYAGQSCAQKLERVRAFLKEKGADGQIYSRLDDVAWLTNLRASDIEYNPFAIAYAAVFADAAFLFIDSSRVPAEAENYLEAGGFTLREYDEIGDFIRNYPKNTSLLVDLGGTSDFLYEQMKHNSRIHTEDGPDAAEILKAVKNPVEIQNFRLAHLYDGCALVYAFTEMEIRRKQGESLTEWTVCEVLKKCRAEQPGNRGESFETIAAWNENAAMMHYAPKPKACGALGRDGLLLVDSGGQYLQGTTDITRTFALGSIPREWKEHYTWVLKGHIALARAVFLEGSTGGNLDILCREPLWRHGIDYRCGTGHGVGMFGSVHEGPQNIRPKSSVALKPGMTMTDEPGVYEKRSHGIRTENLLLVTEAFENEYGKFLRFEPLTLFPIDTKPVLPELMTEEEISWLNGYHRTVYEKLSPRLAGRELEWLKIRTCPLTRA